MTPRRFLGCMLATVVLGVLVVAGINLVIDPYTVFNRPRVPGLNAVKSAVETRERMMKAYQVTQVAPRTVIIGSSRVGIGLDPQSPSWPAAMQPVYNLGLVGSGLATSLRYLALLAASRSNGQPMPDTLVVGLDFETFLQYGPRQAANARRPEGATASATTEIEQRVRQLADGAPRWRGQLLLDQVYALVTLDALGDSMATVLASRAALPGFDLRPDGWMAEGRLQQWTAADGVDILFEQKIGETFRQYRLPRLLLGQTADGPIDELQQLQAVIRFAQQHRMRLILAVQPSHVTRLELLEHMGYWHDYERWKSAVVATVAAAGAAPGAITLWDFGGYEPQVREPMPTGAARTRPLRWFWDPVHYNKALGDLMIANMAAPAAPAHPFGVVLTPDTVNQRLQAVRDDRRAFRREQPALVQQLLARYCKAAAADAVPVPGSASEAGCRQAHRQP